MYRRQVNGDTGFAAFGMRVGATGTESFGESIQSALLPRSTSVPFQSIALTCRRNVRSGLGQHSYINFLRALSALKIISHVHGITYIAAGICKVIRTGAGLAGLQVLDFLLERGDRSGDRSRGRSTLRVQVALDGGGEALDLGES